MRKIWSDYIEPILRRPSLYQLAALCYRRRKGGIEILLITSRETRRWVLPKGWPKNGFDAGGTALEEAWEEAGVKPCGRGPRRVGRYSYHKRLKGNLPVLTDVDVYAIEIAKLYDAYPEAGQRERRWVTPAQAADMVDEPELKTLLADAEVLVAVPVHG